ncbi:MAG: FAD-dependent monooxygenase [Streptosporangiales bacterium]
MRNRTVLISGGGIAGSALAYWLARYGFQPTVVERARDLRSSGSPVDVRGEAVEVAERMGVMAQLREAATHATNLSFVNANGRRIGRLAMSAMQQSGGASEVELPRGDLAGVLYRAARDSAEFVFDDSIATLEQNEDGVDVTFDRTDPRRFDLVVGADGLHSMVRRLAIGAGPDTVRHMGMYVATLPLGGPAEDDQDILMYNTPGRAVSIHPSRGEALAAFMFRRPAVAGFDHHNTEQHKRLLVDAFAGSRWRVPELLDRVGVADDLYFDSVSQVRLSHWSYGRVTLLGDAASCVSLFGEGSSLAITGAATLAEALAANPDDHKTGFLRYETEHRHLVEPKQRNVATASRLLVPATRLGIATRNLATYLAPVAGVVQRVRARRHDLGSAALTPDPPAENLST